MALFVSNLAKLRTRSEACNILVLKCLGLVEFSRVVIVTPKPMAKLGFDLNIMPWQMTPWKVSTHHVLSNLVVLIAHLSYHVPSHTYPPPHPPCKSQTTH